LRHRSGRIENPIYSWATMAAFKMMAATFRPRQRLLSR
jgi:hypothetical protein